MHRDVEKRGPGEAYRVLLLEDSPDDRDIFSRMLLASRAPRFEVQCATSIQQARSMRDEKNLWDAILLDLSLPDTDAPTALTHFRSAVTVQVPVVALTGSNDPHLINDALENGAHDFLCKDTADARLLVHTLHYAILRSRVEAEHALLREKQEEAKRMQTLGRLSAGIAHDFNNLNTIIRGNAELIQAELPADSRWKIPLQDIIQAVQRATNLVGQIAAFAGTSREPFQDTAINEILQYVQGEIRSAGGQKRNIQVDIDAETLLRTRAQPRQLSLAVRHLLDNAVEATDEKDGLITIRTGLTTGLPSDLQADWVRETSRNQPFVFIEVRDNGCGMDRNNRGIVFDPFYTTKFIGRGLGLAAVTGIVRTHEGAISVNTENGLGTTISLFLPAHSGDNAPDE